MKPRLLLLILAGALSAMPPGPPAAAQAYCELRNPVRQIFDLFPEATDYRSVVRTVDDTTREATRRTLPFPLHFNEFGRHTVYVALRHGAPLGLVHVRSEAGQWGLVEIAWALNLDLTVKRFVFQRCRDRARDTVTGPAISRQILGKGLNELRAMLSDNGTALAPGVLGVPPQTRDAVSSLTVTTLRSALKTIAVIQSAWRSDLQEIRWLHAGFTAFDGAQSVDRINGVYAAPGLGERLRQSVGPETGIDRGRAVALLVRGAASQPLGVVLHTPWSAGGQQATVWWVIDADAALRAVVLESPPADRSTAAAFAALKNRTRESFSDCVSPVELAGKEATEVAMACLGAFPTASSHHAH